LVSERHTFYGQEVVSVTVISNKNSRRNANVLRMQAEVANQYTSDKFSWSEQDIQRYVKDTEQKRRVVVLGTGWASHALVKSLKTKFQEVIIVSPRSYFLFTPMLPATAVGTVDFRSIIDPIKTAKPDATYFEASCESVDFKNKRLVCKGMNGEMFSLEYDTLVIGVGARPNTFGIEGVEDHCYFLKQIDDATRIRSKVMDCMETANYPSTCEEERDRLLHFVVVGGGPTGVEFTAELFDFLSKDLKRSFPGIAKHARITLFQSGAEVLPMFDATLREFALKNLVKNNIAVRTNTRVKEVTSTEIILNTGEKVPFGLCVWAAGVATIPLVRKLIEEVREDNGGNRDLQPLDARLTVDPFLRVKGVQDVYALGDCAIVSGWGNALPMTAQVAAQQAEYLASKLNKLAQGEPFDKAFLRPFSFLNLGMLTYVGEDKALAQFEDPVYGFNLGLHGYATWLLWRSVYVTKQVSLRCRVLVLFDFFKTWVFGRDISRF